MTRRPGSSHASDEELLQLADRECSPRRAAKLREHLAQCDPCQERMVALESTLAAFVSLHEGRIHDGQAPSSNLGGRAALKSRLAEARRSDPRPHSWLPTEILRRQLAAACLALLLVGGSLWAMRGLLLRPSASDELAIALPRRRLTPGATRAVRVEQLCSAQEPEGLPPLNATLEQQVFREYGLPVSSHHRYELDYLITPELGGATDVQNLWPEPYASTSWNAHVKDQLEDHLHDLVCAGKLPLATAQSEIAANWIEAYKRYFHTDVPLSGAASVAWAKTADDPREIEPGEVPAL
jgi:hypothetical protein